MGLDASNIASIPILAADTHGEKLVAVAVALQLLRLVSADHLSPVWFAKNGNSFLAQCNTIFWQSVQPLQGSEGHRDADALCMCKLMEWAINKSVSIAK